MALTIDQLKALSFGYLTGADLLQWAAPQLLVKQYEVDNGSLKRGCDIAYAEIIGSLSTRYGLTDELAKKGFTNASATAAVTASAVIAAAVVNAGSNYGSVPAVTFVGGGGSGAIATAILTNGSISAINITSGGAGYTSAPTVVLSGGAAIDTRSTLLVKITSLLADRNALGNAQNISEKMMLDFKWADKALLDIRNGQSNLPIVQPTVPENGIPIVSAAEVRSSSFNTLG